MKFKMRNIYYISFDYYIRKMRRTICNMSYIYHIAFIV